MEFSDRIRTESRPRLRQEEELPASEISFVWAGVPQFTWGAGPCPCREPGCQGDHGDRPGPPGEPGGIRKRPGLPGDAAVLTRAQGVKTEPKVSPSRR